MSELAIRRDDDDRSQLIPFPGARIEISIRPAVPGDLPFIDALQKKHSKMVGFMYRQTIETNIANGRVLIAVMVNEPRPSGSGVGDDGPNDDVVRAHMNGRTSPHPNPLPRGEGAGAPPERIGYVIFNDKYMKREDCGVVYQLNVLPGEHRKLVGATLVKAMFEHVAYGCKLFSCWCAQDLEANHFWESIGFVPLAFRTGSPGRGKNKPPRIHIFWQKRIREGDSETPYWFPSETSGGAIRENRIVLPIPPGTHWSDAKPAVLPGMEKLGQRQLETSERVERKPRKKKVAPPAAASRGGLWFGAGANDDPHGRDARATGRDAGATASKRKAQRKPAQKNDPKLAAAARELCARYLEQLQAPGSCMLLSADGKYDVSRSLAPGNAPGRYAPMCSGVFTAEAAAPRSTEVEHVRLLDAA